MNESPRKVGRPKRLWQAIAAAVVVAGVLLVVVILPAEYGVDPTSVGRLLGFERLNTPGAVESSDSAQPTDELAEIMSPNTVAADPGDHAGRSRAYSSEEAIIELAPLEEVELKAGMAMDDTLLYSWEAGEPVYVDTHGEPLDYPESPAVRYAERDGVRSGHGRITAPFAGLHGWYWLNTNETPITIRLRVAGYYQSLDEVYRSSQ